ncbi:MAG: DMT family transporter [Sulfobacillus sp.]
MVTRTQYLALVGALLAVTAVWGLTFVTVQEAVRSFPVMSFLGWRFGVAALLLVPFTWRDLGKLGWSGVLTGAWIGAFLAAGYVLQTDGLTLISVPTVGFITGLVVVFTPILALIVFRHRPHWVVWVGVALSTAGLWLLTGAGASWSGGDLLVVGSALAFAVQILGTESAVRRLPVGGLVLVEVATTAAISLVWAGAAHQLVVPHLASTWIALGITAIFASVIGGLVQGWVQRSISASRAAIIMSAEPAFAALFAYLLQGSVLNPIGWLGAVLIMVAVLGVQLWPRPQSTGLDPQGAGGR